MKYKDIGFELKEVTGSGTFSGYGSVYGVIDEGDDIVAPGAFTDSLKSLSAKGRMPALLWQHRVGEPAGVYTAIKEDSTGLYVEGRLALKTQRGAEAYELMQMKAISGLSIGFMTRQDNYDQKTGVRTIQKGDLWEVSLVTFPMNDLARVASVKSLEEITDYRAAEEFLRESGLPRSAAIALVSRVKSLAQSESDDDDAGLATLLEVIRRREQIMRV